MTKARAITSTVTFIDVYCAQHQDLFPDVRSFEHLKFLHLGMLADLTQKTLPAIAKAVGHTDAQALHHFLTASPWSATALHQRHLELLKRLIGERPLTLCVDETGDRKKARRRTDIPPGLRSNRMFRIARKVLRQCGQPRQLGEEQAV